VLAKTIKQFSATISYSFLELLVSANGGYTCVFHCFTKLTHRMAVLFPTAFLNRILVITMKLDRRQKRNAMTHVSHKHD